MKRFLTRTWSGWRLPLCTLVLLLPSCVVPAAPPPVPTNLPPNDWRQLWPKASYDTWFNKPEPELRRLADQGQPAAQFVLWEKWKRTRKDEARAMLEAAGKAGLPQAMAETGFTLFIKTSAPEEARREGWKMLEKAAATGYPQARAWIASYDAGFAGTEDPVKQRLVKPNLVRAVEYARDAGRAGFLDSAVELALLYSSGVGEPPNREENPHNILVWAAARGSRRAMELLSDRYLFGHGETADPVEAARWLYLVARDDPHSSRLTPSDREGDPQSQDTPLLDDRAKLLALFKRAGDTHNAEAALALSKRYGQAGKNGQAVALLRIAKRWGSQTASGELAALEPKLTPEEKKIADDPTLFPFE